MGELPPAIPRAVPALSDRLRAFVLICLQFALILGVLHRYDIEEQKHVFPVYCLGAAAFVIHAWLPRRWRAWFFVVVSLTGILMVLDWPNGSKAIGIGLGLIALCHLPVPLLLRAVLLLLAGAVLAGLRVDYPA